MPFEKGWKGGPGRPTYREAIARIGAKASGALDDDGRTLTKTEAVVWAAYDEAMNGNIQAARFLAEHSEGSKTEITVTEVLTDAERIERIADLLDRARLRAAQESDPAPAIATPRRQKVTATL